MYAREYRSTRPHKAIFFHLSCLTLICSAQVYAKPDMRPLGPNIADKGSVFYHFSVTSFDSVDGTRHYRVWTAVPNTTAPASGYPILYMLDGNAVMDRLDDELLKQLSEKTPPVIVAVGYQTNLLSISTAGLTTIRQQQKAEKQISTQGILAVRVVAATTSASYWKRVLPQKWNRD